MPFKTDAHRKPSGQWPSESWNYTYAVHIYMHGKLHIWRTTWFFKAKPFPERGSFPPSPKTTEELWIPCSSSVLTRPLELWTTSGSHLGIMIPWILLRYQPYTKILPHIDFTAHCTGFGQSKFPHLDWVHKSWSWLIIIDSGHRYTRIVYFWSSFHLLVSSFKISQKQAID